MTLELQNLEKELKDAQLHVANIVKKITHISTSTALEGQGIHAAIILKEYGYFQESIKTFNHLFKLGFRNDQVLFEYIQLLRRLERHAEADKITVDTINKEKIYGHNLAREVIVRLLLEENVLEEKSGEFLKALTLILTNSNFRYEAQVANYLSSNEARECLEEIKNAGFTTLDDIQANIISHIRQRMPFCLIRLGDGEGPFLQAQEINNENNLLFELSRSFFTNRWFGSPHLAQNDAFLQIGLDINQRLNEADIIGMPNFDWFSHEIKLRNLKTIFNCFEVAKSAIRIKNSNNCIQLTTTSVAIDLEYRGLFKDIVKSSSNLVLITSHSNLAGAIQEKYGVKTVRTICIPPAQSDLKITGYQSTERNFEEELKTVKKEIENIQPFSLVLVAAGFLGKLYSLEAKKNDCISIDIGSLADLWMGFMTRPGFHALPSLRLQNQVAP